MPVTRIRGGGQITDGTVPYEDIQNVAANTILGNNTASAARIQEIALAASTLLGRGVSGNIAAITAGNGVTFSGTSLVLAAGYGDTINPYGSKTANFVLAAPNGSAGVPTFRLLAAADIPALSYVTSVALASGTTGTDVNISGSPITSSGTLTINIPSASATARGLVTTTNQTFAGEKSFTGAILVETSTTVANHISIKSGSNGYGFQGTGYVTISSNNPDNLTFVFQTGTKVAHLVGSSLTAARSYTLPNASGTLALTSDISTNYQAPLNGTGFVRMTGTTVSYITGTSSQFVKADGSLDPTAYTANTGTVTSVGGTGTVSGLTLSGTVTTSGNLTLGGTLSVLPSNFSAYPANTVFAGPTSGGSATPSFRGLVAADIPALPYLTSYTETDTLATVTGRGNTTTTGIGASNFFDGTGTYNVNLGSGGAEGRGLVAGYSGSSYAGIGYNVKHTTTGGSWIAPGPDTASYILFTNGGFQFYGTGTGTAGRSISWTSLATLNSSGTFNATNVTVNGNQAWHAGNDGSGSGLDADLLDGNHASAFYLATNPNSYTSNTGTVTSVALSLPGIFSVSGSPVTTSGTLTATLASQTANTFFAAPNGSAGSPSFRAIAAADIPALSYQAPLNGTGYVKMSGTSVSYIASIPNADLANSSFFVGTTSISLGRASAAQTLSGVSIDGTAVYLSSQDTRNTATTPETGNASSGIRFDFKANTTNSLSDGGSFNGVMYWRKYGSTTDWTGGGALELAYTDNGNMWHRYGTSTTWGAWRRLWNGNDFSSTNISNWNTAYGWGNHSGLYLPLSGGTLTGGLTISNGADLILKASSGSDDSGDLVFQHGNGTELHRLWNGTNTLNYRANAGTTYQLIHTGNDTDFVRTRSTVVNTNSSDLNTFTTAGTYQVSTPSGNWTGSSNGPTNAYPYGQLVVTVNGNIVTQFYYAHQTNGHWVRSKFNASDWQSWQKIWTDANLTNLNQLTNGPGYITASSLGDYLPLAGGTMTGNINWGQTDRGLTWNFNTDGAHIKFYNTGNGDTDSRLEYATYDDGNEYHKFLISGNERFAIKNANTTVTGNFRSTGGISTANHSLTSAYININDTTVNGYLITTNIDYTTFNMPTVIIEGYAYGGGQVIHLEIVWYSYNNGFTNYSYTNLGMWDPGIVRIGTNSNGKVCIHLSNNIYYGRFNVRCIYDQGFGPLEGWTVTDAGTSGLSRLTTVSRGDIYTNIAGSATQVTINYGNDSNSNYQMLWGSGNYVYGTAGIYCNPSTDTIYTYAYRGSGNVGGTGEASWHPAGIYSGGTQWLYGTTYRNNAATYGQGNLYFDGNYGYGLVGLYSDTRYQAVFAMGDSYKLPADGTTTGTLYGLAWSHPNKGGVAANLNTHGLLVMENGAFLAAVSGSIRARDDMRAPIFYDLGNSSYSLNGDTNSAWRISTPSGYLDIGPMNAGYCHFQTDRATFYFNKRVDVDGELWRYGGSRFVENTGTWGINITGNANNITQYTVNQNVGTGDTVRFNQARFTSRISIGDGNGTPFLNGGSPGVWLSYNGGSDLFMGAETATQWGVYISSAWRMSVNSSGTITAGGDIVAYGSPSDARLKTIKEVIQNPIEKVKALSGYRFDWKETGSILNLKEDIGVIAQEVAAVLPELARTNDNGYMSVRYQGLTAVLIEAVKEQQSQIESLKKQIEYLVENSK